MTRNNKWNVVLECADEEGDLSTWAKEINHPVYGRYVWVTSISKDVVVVEVESPETHAVIELKSCKTVQAAKRWATMNLDVEVCDSVEEKSFESYSNVLEGYENHIMRVITHNELNDCVDYINGIPDTESDTLINELNRLDELLNIAINFKWETYNCISKYVSDFYLLETNEISQTKLMLDNNGLLLDLSRVNAKLIKYRDMFSEYQIFYNRLVNMFDNNGEYGLINLLDRMARVVNTECKQFTPVEVLRHDGCTKSEAIKHLDRGTLVFELADFYRYLGETDTDYDDIKNDCSFLTIGGYKYAIMYVL